MENKIGVTETYDPSYDYSWLDNLKPVNIIITKNLTDKMILELISDKCKKSCILHLTITGWGDQFMEPNVPDLEWSYNQYIKLINSGFDPSHVILRLDPILPSTLGLIVARKVLDKFINTEIKRVRVSSLDMYKHVLDRFSMIGVNPPYKSFHAPDEMMFNLDSMLSEYSNRYEFESCAEVKLRIPRKVGCVSRMDIDLINPEFPITLEGSSRQRSTCLCPGNKIQIIRTKPRRCPNKCIYCYWRD